MENPMTKEERVAKLIENAFHLLCALAVLIPLFILAWLIIDTSIVGIKRLDMNFILGYPSRFPHLAGILPAFLGTLYLMALTALIALPVGIAAAVYLEQYAKDSWYKNLIELNIANLAGVPSIIFGLLGLEIFVRALKLGPSLIAGALTLSLLILPVVITAAREALKTVPNTLIEAGLGLGATRLSVVIRVVLPLSMSQIITGAILSIARAIGETAPIIVIGAATFLSYVPTSVMSEFSALPLQIFQWVERPNKGFLENASAAIVVLLTIFAAFNILASWLRRRQERNRGGL
jgi:phosphate transport system permease protein